MVTLYGSRVLLDSGTIVTDPGIVDKFINETDKTGTIASGIFTAHNVSGDTADLKLKFDAMASHDITYVNIIQTAKASGLTEFPLPYALTNCHNSLCAVGGTINGDDHAFGLSAAVKYGGLFVPAHLAVIHQYMRETAAACGKMILGSDSHTRYGALGALSVGEGGGELVKQLLGKTYDIKNPEIIGVYLHNAPAAHIGPMDVALTIIKAVFKNGFVKNKVMEFVGPGVENLSVDFRNGVDVMTTETACLSSIWQTDEMVREYFITHGRPGAYKKLEPAPQTLYDGMIAVDLSKVEPCVAMPFHPSNVYTVAEFKANLADIVNETEKKCAEQLGAGNGVFNLKSKIINGKFVFDQGVIAGCAGGTFENLTDAADILRGAKTGGGGYGLSVYPASAPVLYAAMENGTAAVLTLAGAIMRSAFCGPCFGAGDVPASNGVSLRHTTRNFENREGSKPSAGQTASVVLADAKTVAATSANGGVLTSAADLDVTYTKPAYRYNGNIYANRVYNGYGAPDGKHGLVYGPGIADWPEIQPMPEHLLLITAAVINDPVTTTDELIPSGETSSYRSNPLGLAEFTLSRKDPGYVGRAKQIREYGQELSNGQPPKDLEKKLVRINNQFGIKPSDIGIGSVVCAVKPGDGSAREQAASCQRVLGGAANIAAEYATKRYRSNLINWGMLPFISGESGFKTGDMVFIKNIRNAVKNDEKIEAYLINGDTRPVELSLSALTGEEREILLAGCLINYNCRGKKICSRQEKCL